MASSILLNHPSSVSSSPPSSLSQCAFLKSIKFHTLRQYSKRRSFVVKAESSHESNITNNHDTGGMLDRREVVTSMATSGLSLALMFQQQQQQQQPAKAEPIVPPDLSTCTPASVNAVSGTSTPTKYVDCCLLPPKQPIIDFKLPHKPTFRTRHPAHRVDDAYIAKYTRAYELMRALPSDDPRSLQRQADIHCAFCNGAYSQLGSNNKLQIHFSWLFFPWHRWYLYFHERILGHLIGDPKFSLVFWNWDNQSNVGGNVMPAMFTKEGSVLYDAKRHPNHLPPVLNTLSLSDLGNTTLTNEQIIQDNLNVMYQSIVTASTPDLFMGKKYSNGDPEPNIGGTLENAPHTSIHAWTGDNRETYLEDMGNFYSAARDPIFYAHHSNVDRLWTVWNKIGGRRKDHTDPDFLDAEFIFYDENARMVRVKVKDALDTKRLGVSYEKVKEDTLWLNYEPQPLGGTETTTTKETIVKIGPATENSTPVKVDGKLKSLVERPSSIPQDLLEKEGEDVEEVLVLEEVMVPRNVVTHLAVFINLPNADENTPISCAEYVGSFVHIPHLFGSGTDSDTHSATIRFGITDNLVRLGLANDQSSDLLVTIVSKVSGGTITIKGIKIEYE